MAFIKKAKDKGSHTLVTFTVGASEASNSSQVMLLGDFNDWQIADTTCQMNKKGSSFEKSVKLENGKRYEFRYLSPDNGWFNDHAADDYVPSPYYGIDNSVVDLTVMPKAKAQKKKVVKKTPVKKVSAKKTPVKKAKKDDLKKIEGIGPKIASILTEKGIGTFKKLSSTSVSVLEAILKEAGPRYQMHKPGSWHYTSPRGQLFHQNVWHPPKA